MHESYQATENTFGDATATLFIGGTHDGVWLPIVKTVDVVELPRRQSASMRSLFDLFFESEDVERYRRHTITGEQLFFSVFAPSRMSTDEMIAWLIAGYGKVKVQEAAA